ncbi:MAG: sulfatase [Lentisphaeraceae bacterium]|nr:sulfatase [Lentisphaeraceae bacterium]
MKSLCIFIYLLIALSCFAEKKPNILFAISDDQSWPHASAYGDKVIQTPAFDRVAKSGVLFDAAFCAAPQCSPSRAAILTGRQIWELQEAGVHASFFPIEYKSYPEVLAKSGYHVGYTGKAWGPGDYKYTGRKLNPAGKAWSKIKLKAPVKAISGTNYSANFKEFYKARKADQPFCFWYGAHEPHRAYEYGVGKKNGKDPKSVEVPPFLPDNEVTRNDILDYAYEIEWFDKHLGEILDFLEEKGELDNTLVIVTADNGMPFPRAKANLYELGTHVPMAISWGKNFKTGSRVKTPVSSTQVAATIFEVTGISQPKTVTQKSLVPLLNGQDVKQVVFAGRERHTHARYNNWTYPCRSIRTENFLLIHNMKADRWPAGDPKGEKFYDIDGCPSKTEILKENGPFLALSTAKRPEFELFDISKDPFCMKNLADNPEYKTTMEDLAKQLHKQLKEDGDPRFNGFGDIFESYPRISKMRPFMGGFHERGKYNPEYIQENQKVKKETIGKPVK